MREQTKREQAEAIVAMVRSRWRYGCAGTNANFLLEEIGRWDIRGKLGLFSDRDSPLAKVAALWDSGNRDGAWKALTDEIEQAL